MVMRSNGNERRARVLLPSAARAMKNQTINPALRRDTRMMTIRSELANKLIRRASIFIAPCCCPSSQSGSSLATPFSLARFREISLGVLSLPLYRVEIEQGQTCCSCHPVSFLLWNVVPRLVGLLSTTTKVRRKRLVVVMEKFC